MIEMPNVPNEPEMNSFANDATDERDQVSVIVPAYNNAATIEKALSSALSQGELVKEVLVYDDCSNDSTPELLAAFARANPRVKVIVGKHNRGAGVARRTLLHSASGRFIAFLDADDYWVAGKLKTQIEEMSRTGADVCTTDLRINDTSRRTVTNLRPKTVAGIRSFWWQNPIPMSTAVVRTSVVGWRDMPTLRARQDYAYWIKIFSANPEAKHVNVPEQLTMYRRTPDGLSGQAFRNLRNNYKMFREAIGFGRFLAGIRTIMNVVGKFRKERSQRYE